MSLHPSKDRRYRVTDPYPRFWLHPLGPSMDEIRAGARRSDPGPHWENWTNWPGRAVEPVVREASARLLPDGHLPAARAVGGHSTRTNDVEIDVVGADRAPVAKEFVLVGSVKCLEQSPFDRHDLAALLRHRAALTDRPIPVVAIARSGVDCGGARRRLRTG
ncbi:hypothetical protein STENM223S_03036 [Streptomyces tendae]